MHALTATVAGALLLLALRTAPTTPLESPELGGHGHGGRGGQRASERAARLPIPTPQEIDALRQLLRLLASLAGSSQVADESASFLVPPAVRRSMSPAHPAHPARRASAASALAPALAPATE